MAARLQFTDAVVFRVQFQEACLSAHGRNLAETIDRNEHVMIQASLLEHPALAPLLPLLSDELVDALALDDDGHEDGNDLMRAFGHMVRLEMNILGFFQFDGERRSVNWPFQNRSSQLAVFRRANNEAAQ